MANAPVLWAEAEFAKLDLGDARLNKRARMLMERFIADPTASVDWRDIMAPHWEHTEQRMAERDVVLCLQDTTELNFNGQDAVGLGPLSYEAQRGMYLPRPMPSRPSGSHWAL